MSDQYSNPQFLRSELEGILSKSIKSSRDIARGITIIENSLDADLEMDSLYEALNAPICCRVGITGSPGVGKSSLMNSLLNSIDLKKVKVAVVAVDPSSRKTMGALLADRIRVSDNSIFENIYFRSLASRGSYGGLVQNIDLILDFLAYCGFDLIFVETVGVGQNEVDIESSVDVLVHVVDSKAGDSIQIAKAGVMEIGDIFFVNKNDIGINPLYVEDLVTLPHLKKKHSNPADAIVTGSATKNEGISEVIDLISRLTSNTVILRGRINNE